MLVPLIRGDKLSDERENNARKTDVFVNVPPTTWKTALELLAMCATIATSFQMAAEKIVKQMVLIMPYLMLYIIRRVNGSACNNNPISSFFSTKAY